MDKCTGYTYCGQREKHPEYIGETNQVKAAIKKTRERIEALESQLNSLKNFETQSEYQFIKNMKPRLLSLNSSYAQNKPMLMRDLRLLRTHLKGKIPPVTTNDLEQLGILLEKCKRELRNKIGNEYSMLSTATIDDHPVSNASGATTANGQGSTVNVFNISPRTKSSNEPKTKSSMKRNKNGHNPKDIEDDYSSSQSEESDVSSDESKYSKKKKRQRRKGWFGESRNRYRQLEPSFNYPFPYHPYHYSTNPMAMPMQFGPYVNPHQAPQLAQFSPVLPLSEFHSGNGNGQLIPNMQLVGSHNYDSGVSDPTSGKLCGTPAVSSQAINPEPQPFDALLQAVGMTDNRYSKKVQ